MQHRAGESSGELVLITGGALLEGAGNCSNLRSESHVWAGGDARLARAETGYRHPLRSLRQGGAAAGDA
eukprot:7841475-Alexandrium_andersonii.AAC.1